MTFHLLNFEVVWSKFSTSPMNIYSDVLHKQSERGTWEVRIRFNNCQTVSTLKRLKLTVFSKDFCVTFNNLFFAEIARQQHRLKRPKWITVFAMETYRVAATITAFVKSKIRQPRTFSPGFAAKFRPWLRPQSTAFATNRWVAAETTFAAVSTTTKTCSPCSRSRVTVATQQSKLRPLRSQ